MHKKYPLLVYRGGHYVHRVNCFPAYFMLNAETLPHFDLFAD